MSNYTKPDFAKKLLNDLKMRKERLAAAAHSSGSADTYGISRRSLKGSSEMKSIAKASSNTSKVQRSANRSQNARMNVDNSNQIVPYGEVHTTKQPLDLSMTLSYALDENGKLKNMNLTGSSAMIGFLRQISRRSMDDRSGNGQIQWPSSAQFPTLTSLHVDEVSKGAQKLNHILKSFYKGLNSNNSDRRSVDMGKELLKGAMELEESLRMLVSLQENVPQRKSRVKLLEMGEEKDEKGNQKRVERPVFSFDHGKDQKRVSSHRRSVSSPVTSTSTSTQVNGKAGRGGIPNVVAKLMGLEDIPRNGGESKMRSNQLTQSEKGLDQIVSRRMSFGEEDDWRNGSYSKMQDCVTSNKIVILTSKKIEPQKEIGDRKPAWSETEKDRIITHIMEMKDKSEIKENVGVKRGVNKDEVQRTENVVQEKRISKDKLQHPKSPHRVEVQRKNQKLEPRNIQKAVSKAKGRKIEASERVIENSLPKDIHEVNSSKSRFITSVQAKDVKDEKDQTEKLSVENDKKMLKSRANQKANEVMAKPIKSSNRTSRAMKQQETILQGLKQRKPVEKVLQQPKVRTSRRVESKGFGSKNAKVNTDKARSTCNGESKQDLSLEVPCDQPLMLEKNPESKPQASEIIHLSADIEERHPKKKPLVKIEIQQPLTDDEIYLKEILIKSQVFLNTAEALFKLNIPIGIILNATETTCQEEEQEDSKLITECGYEMLKMKGKRRELVFYNCKNAFISNMNMKTLDDLVRQLHKDFEKLRSYGKTINSEKDQAEFLLKMVERDMYQKDMDLSCMWDLGWKDTVFGYVEMDEVIRDVEKCLINELIDGVLEGLMEISVTNVSIS